MTWHEKVISLVENDRYGEVAQFYENLLETETDTISYYWYLGISYLLQEKEEEAQSVWLLILSQDDEESFLTLDLLETLEREASRQIMAGQDRYAHLIRLYIQEINPDDLNNLLQLILLEMKLNLFYPDILNQWDIESLFARQKADHDSLLQVMVNLLSYPHPQTLVFLNACIASLPAPQNFREIVVKEIVNRGYQHSQPLWAIDLTKLLVQYEPDNLGLLNNLFILYKGASNYQQCLSIAGIFCQEDKSILVRTFGLSLKISVLHECGDWLNLPPLIIQMKDLLKEMEDPRISTDELFIRDALLGLTSSLPYFEDQPQENRTLQNKLSQYFQKQINPDFSHLSPPVYKQILKIGYIASTLRRHSVGWLSRWLFQHHNREKFKIYIYLVGQPEDDITDQWFRKNAETIHNLPSNPRLISEKIREDQIDILVDLDSITKNTTYHVMALKPAPVQVTWLGLDASGLPAIDYFLADNYVLPPDAGDYYREKIWRLPHTYLAVDGFEIGVPTLRREDLGISPDSMVYLTLQSGLKRNRQCIGLQMEIIKAVPDSYLLIKGSAKSETIRELFISIARSAGVNIDRLRFLPNDTCEETHRGNLQIADVVLDTFPYNGATTTLEVLWAGIPLVSRVGRQFAARNSYTFMTNAGIEEGIAHTGEEYVEWGIKLGTDESLRGKVVEKLRLSRQISPLWNGENFALEIEKAYGQMWRDYCEKDADAQTVSGSEIT
ncbi:MAG: hypothetical protein N5P05_002996 [Chroococcopsis gigantea SAG 12.99]|nr:O-linked N-acetylglucosamine transferase, SPINDLY family protein [Chlorogloea purpurea SAG 13.99]MDV3001390.1 hypothetical protein [Chroococcopsis gigantea SAG 12.99]